MTRKNNPKQTMKNIIEVSAKLFIEKGFDKTSMQDIVDALGMSKGAIFHHFKSKEEILYAVMDEHYGNIEKEVYKCLDDIEGVNAKEKITLWLEKTFNEIPAHPLDNVVSPQMTLAYMQNTVSTVAPHFAKIIQEGIEDGSITTEFPDECAQMFFLLMNFWCDPVLFKCSAEDFLLRLKYFQHMMKQLGMDVISDELIKMTYEYFI